MKLRKKLIQIKNAIKYLFILVPNQEKVNRLYKGGYISLATYKRITRLK